MGREDFTAIRAAAPTAPPGETSFDYEVGIPGAIGNPVRGEVDEFLWHPSSEVTIRFVAVTVSIDD
jgi:hypothetical protein